jgi:ribulose-5-phosphate 4-epimerase/fuculose-1-phosphate aldolase
MNELDLQAARARLAARGLLGAGDSVSMRVPGADACMFLTEPERGEAGSRRLPLSSAAADPAEVHRLVYLARPDVGAVLLNRQPWAAALPAAGGTLPGLFDEQLRHLGWNVPQIAAPASLPEARRRLAGGGNAFGVGNQVLCLGMTGERLVFNAELLEKSAKAFVLASATGLGVTKIPWLVQWIATRRLRRDQKRAAASYARGQTPPKSAGYK